MRRFSVDSRVCLALFFWVLGAAAYGETIWCDSHGFEAPYFAVGSLDGYQGWTASKQNSGLVAVIAAAPDTAMGAQAIRLEDGPGLDDASDAEIRIPDPLAAGYSIVKVSFDIFRAETGQLHDLAWWWSDSGVPTEGIQLGLQERVYPFGLDGAGFADTVRGRSTHIMMIWNFHIGKAVCWYDGSLVDYDVPITAVASLSAWHFRLHHGRLTENPTDTAWIDNLVITVGVAPEVSAISDVKTLPDGADVNCFGTVTALFADRFYIESADRSSGIMVQNAGFRVEIGQDVTVMGRMSTRTSGERSIVADSVGTL